MQVGTAGKAISDVVLGCFKKIEQLHGAKITSIIQKINRIDQKIKRIEETSSDSELIEKLNQDAEMHEFALGDLLSEEPAASLLSTAEQACNTILQEAYGEEYRFAFEEAGGQAIGNYIPKTKTISISPYNAFLRLSNNGLTNYQELSGFIDHEISHLLQYKYNQSKSEKMHNNYLQGLHNRQHGDVDSYETLYLNSPLERQAFLSNIVNELSNINPELSSFGAFINFLNQSHQWSRMVAVLYPENRASMIRALYKYYSSQASNQLPNTNIPVADVKYDQAPF